jgi:hypothetical protein
LRKRLGLRTVEKLYVAHELHRMLSQEEGRAMRTPHSVHETPSSRLRRLARISLPRPRELKGLESLKFAGLLLLFATIVGVAVVGGESATAIIREYAELIQKLASGFRR